MRENNGKKNGRLSAVNVVTDAIPISRLVDGTLFMVSSNDANKHEAKNALTLL